MVYSVEGIDFAGQVRSKNEHHLGFAHLSNHRLTFIPDPVEKAPIIMDMVYYSPWLDEISEDHPSGRRTNRVVQTQVCIMQTSPA